MFRILHASLKMSSSVVLCNSPRVQVYIYDETLERKNEGKINRKIVVEGQDSGSFMSSSRDVRN